MNPVSCTNTHHDVTDLINHRMVKNTKYWISWERNTTFLQNKKILKQCLRWHILRSYCFVAEVTIFCSFFFVFQWSVNYAFFRYNRKKSYLKVFLVFPLTESSFATTSYSFIFFLLVCKLWKSGLQIIHGILEV